MNALEQTILDVLKGFGPQDPLRRDDLIVAGKPEQIDAALDSLYDQRAINRCSRMRDGETWVDIWPTGVIAPVGATNPVTNSPIHARTYTRPTRPVEPSKQEQRTMPKQEKQRRRKGEMDRDILIALADTTPDNPKTTGQIATAIGTIAPSVLPAIKRLAKHGLVMTVENPERKGTAAYCLPSGDPVVEATLQQETAKVQPETAITAEPEEAEIEDDGEFDFCLWANGGLVIQIGDEQHNLPPVATARLFQFLLAAEGVVNK